MSMVSRKSMHFSRDMNAGDSLKEKDVVLMRPGNGLYVSLLPKILGRKINTFVKKGSMVNLSDFIWEILLLLVLEGIQGQLFQS